MKIKISKFNKIPKKYKKIKTNLNKANKFKLLLILNLNKKKVINMVFIAHFATQLYPTRKKIFSDFLVIF